MKVKTIKENYIHSIIGYNTTPSKLTKDNAREALNKMTLKGLEALWVLLYITDRIK